MKKQLFSYGWKISIESIGIETIISGLPRRIVDRIEDLVREWQSNEFDPSGLLEFPTEIESILIDWVGEDVFSHLNQGNIAIENGNILIY